MKIVINAEIPPDLEFAPREPRENAKTEPKLKEKFFLEKEYLLFESQRIGSWSWNLTSRKAIWSDETYRIFGLDQVTVKPTQKVFFTLIHPDEQAMISAWYADCASGNAPAN